MKKKPLIILVTVFGATGDDHIIYIVENNQYE